MTESISNNNSSLPVKQPEANKKVLILTSAATGAMVGAAAGAGFGPVGILAGAVAGAVAGVFAALATFAINALMDRSTTKQVEAQPAQAIQRASQPQSNAHKNAEKLLSALESRMGEVTNTQGLGRIGGNDLNINKLAAGEDVPDASVHALFLALKRIFNNDLSILQNNLNASDYIRIQGLIDNQDPSTIAEIVKLLNPDNAELTARYIRLLNRIAQNANNNQLTSYALNLSGFNMQITRTLPSADQLNIIRDEKEASPKLDESKEVSDQKAANPRVGAFIIENADAIAKGIENATSEKKLNELRQQLIKGNPHLNHGMTYPRG